LPIRLKQGHARRVGLERLCLDPRIFAYQVRKLDELINNLEDKPEAGADAASNEVSGDAPAHPMIRLACDYLQIASRLPIGNPPASPPGGRHVVVCAWGQSPCVLTLHEHQDSPARQQLHPRLARVPSQTLSYMPLCWL
jgi:hypothetical protein